MAVHASVAARAERPHTLPEQRDFEERMALAGEREHGLSSVRHGHANPSIDRVPNIGRRTMEERTSDVQHTGTLPIGGQESVPVTPAEEPRRERPAWVDEARAGLAAPGKYLAYEESGRQVVRAIEREWTRIGRSLAADLRFDDATVSRRHALIVSQADGVRVLDDRSLNGIYVNGSRVEWSPLADGDEVTIGRHTIYFVDTESVVPPVAAAPAATAE
jgi:FHA domain-containing protein